MLNSEIVRDDRGVYRCARKIMKAIPRVLGDDSKGYYNAEAICNAPITTRMSDGVKGCPNCDKEPPVGNVHPRTTNSAGISLTPAELKELGLTEDKIPAAPKHVTETQTSPVEGTKMSEVRKDVIAFEIPLDVLESDVDVAALLIKSASNSLDLLPVTNFKESKRLIKLQEKLESLLKV